MAKLLLGADQAMIAVPILEELSADVDRFHLAQWDKELAVQVWSQCLVGLRHAAAARANYPGEDWGARIEDIKNKISLVDIETALAQG